MISLRREAASALEQGRFAGVAARVAAKAFQTFSDPVRRVWLPRGARVIGVGGATLGGSGKTPVVLALARARAGAGKIAVVAHGYAAKPGAPRRVSPSDSVRLVGDDALWLARELTPLGVPVVVAASRQRATDFAASLADTLIVDGLLQTRPVRLSYSLLVLDGERPWGVGRCPPAGDLRASPERLNAACDRVLEVVSRVEAARTPEGTRIPLSELRGARVGLVLAIARPERVLGSLALAGVTPVVVETEADHAGFSPSRRRDVDVWLTSGKCATKLGSSRAGAPVWVLDHHVSLPADLVAENGPIWCVSPHARSPW